MSSDIERTNSGPEAVTTYRGWLYGRYVTGAAAGAGRLDSRRMDELYGRFLTSRPRRVLEIGAGAGDVVAWLRERGVDDVWGVDTAVDQLDAASALGRDVRCSDLFEALAACDDGSLDGLVAIDVLEHLTRDELVRVATEAARVLAPGAAFLVQVPNGHALRVGPIWTGDLTHETLLSDVTLAQLFAPAGLTLESVWGVTPGYGKLSRAIRTVLWKLITVGARLVDILESGRTERVYERVFCALLRKAKA